jgi:hypothetical protein
MTRLIAIILMNLATLKATGKLKYFSTIWPQLGLLKHQTTLQNVAKFTMVILPNLVKPKELFLKA